jgi:hypothetical protein
MKFNNPAFKALEEEIKEITIGSKIDKFGLR